jgi:hypothetical protein
MFDGFRLDRIDVGVVCPDLRLRPVLKPPDGPDHAGYSKRAMAEDCLVLMRARP